MDSLQLFTPYQDPNMCLWFYFLSIIGFGSLIFTLVTGILYGISKKKDASFYLALVLLSFSYFFFYLQNRILYSMCSKVIR